MRQVRITAAVACGVLSVIWSALPARSGGRFGDTSLLGIVATTAIAAAAVVVVARPTPPARLGAVTGVAAAFGTFALIGPLQWSSGLSVVFRILIVAAAAGVVWTTLPARRWRSMLHQNELGLVMLGGGLLTVSLWVVATRASVLGIVLAAGALVAASYGVVDRGAWARWLSGGLAASLASDLLFDQRGTVGVVGLLSALATVAVVVLAERTAVEAPPVADPDHLDHPVPERAQPGSRLGGTATGGPASWAAPTPGAAGAVATVAAGGYASFGQRFAGSLVDGLVAVLFDLPGWVLLIAAMASASTSPGAGIGLLLAAMACFVVTSFAAAIHYCLRLGRTGQYYGHRTMGIMLVDAGTGQPIGPGRVFLRGLCRIVSTIPLCAGCVAMLWHPRGQTWHDRMANTVVVNTTAAPATVAATVAT